jgi:hypothetical protein
MAKQKVLLSICDRCGTDETSPLQQRGLSRKDPYVLPKGWMHISANTASSTIFELDLCGDCKKIVLEAAGHARRLAPVRQA